MMCVPGRATLAARPLGWDPSGAESDEAVGSCQRRHQTAPLWTVARGRLGLARSFVNEVSWKP